MPVRPADRLIIALDFPGLAEALALVERTGPEVLWYKVGLELFSAAGPEAVRALIGRGKQVFLDLKLHDIPNTVARAAGHAATLGVELIDLHVAAGESAMRAAAGAVREATTDGRRPKLLGVTVLTSAVRADPLGDPLDEQGLARTAAERAEAARAAGLDGVVAPARAISEIRRRCGDEFLILTPGIRPAGAARGDQRWTATPAEAVRAGARWIVVGRPIIAAPDPAEAARRILQEMEQGTAGD
ncbi:MAG: orotidine-5'-phosphate decarboxylase [Candidatus Eisenbacteria bacterium]